jgi:hypothetical protein
MRTQTTLPKTSNEWYQRGYQMAMRAAAEMAHEHGRRVYGSGRNKVRDVLHQLGKELDPNVKY